MITSDIGVACPECGSSKSSTPDSRADSVLGVPSRKRRRKCVCGHIYSTFELSDAVLDVLLSRVRTAVKMQNVVELFGKMRPDALDEVVRAFTALQAALKVPEHKIEIDLSDNPVDRAKPHRRSSGF